MIETRIKLMTEAEQRGDDRSREHWRIEVEEGARDYASYLDTQLASAYQTLLHLHHVNHFLNRRLHGTTRTRLASSFVR